MKAFILIGLITISGINGAVSAPIAIGELIDKITILEIKVKRLKDTDKKANASFELAQLKKTLHKEEVITPTNNRELAALMKKLQAVNEKLWDIENAIRAKESQKLFDDEFIFLARSVYHNNRERSEVKRAINLITDSSIIEEKEYTSFDHLKDQIE